MREELKAKVDQENDPNQRQGAAAHEANYASEEQGGGKNPPVDSAADM
jgi:hypothetical protein